MEQGTNFRWNWFCCWHYNIFYFIYCL